MSNPFLPNIPDEVWQSRALLKDIRDRAHARCASADAVLGTVLTSVAAYIPAHVRIDTGVLVPASPTLYAVLASPSGVGKTTGWGVGRALVPGQPRPLMLSTGEGLIEGFYGWVRILQPQPDDKPPKPVRVRRRVVSNRMIYVDEGESMFKQMDRPGNLVGSTLRSFWSGGDVGQDNADKDLCRGLAAGSYTGGMVVGLQPDIAGRLLADTGTGTAQRFLWFAVLDPNVPDTPPLGPFALGPLCWTPPRLPGDLEYGSKLEAWAAGPPAEDAVWVEPETPSQVLMTVDAGIRAEIHAQTVRRIQGKEQPDEHDSQRPAMHAKVAGVLAWTDGRLSITREDWEIAGGLLKASAAVRDALIEHAEERSVKAARDKGAERAQVRAAEAEADVVRERCATKVSALLMDAGRAGMPRGEIMEAVSRPQRPFVAEVLATMIARDEVSEAEAPHGGRRYRIAGSTR